MQLNRRLVIVVLPLVAVTMALLAHAARDRAESVTVAAQTLLPSTPAKLSEMLPGVPLLPPGTVCEQTAWLARKAARKEARGDFFKTLGDILNDPTGDPLIAFQDAQVALQEALDLAQEQYQARLALCPLLGSGPYDPSIDPAEFSPNVTNPLFPLVPGQTLVFHSMTPEGLEVVEDTTLSATVMIAGVECRAVHDVVSLNGEVTEDTFDWYAQKSDGSVWYFGESAKTFEDGLLDNLEGSWRTGKDGAKPGIIMEAAPAYGDAYRQEFLINVAEDVALVDSLYQTVTVPYGTFTNSLKTVDWSPLEPDVFAVKFYAPNVGVVKEVEDGIVTELVNVINN